MKRKRRTRRTQPTETPARKPSRGLQRVAIALLAAVGVLVAWYIAARGPRYAGPARHVIVISLDTTRADHLGCYGNAWIQTPNLDALAAESILFADHLTAVTTTLASHTSLFTGKYPQSHGVPRNGFVVHDDNVMLAEILRDAGFHTAGFLGSFALESRFNFAQGFEDYDEWFDTLVGPGGFDQNQRDAAAVTDAVIKYLDGRRLPRNLFLFAHYFDPHMPYTPPAPFDRMYGDDELPGTHQVSDHPALVAGPRTAEIRKQLYSYAGEVSYADLHIGRLLIYLRTRGILDDAILVVTSDHGEELTDTKGRPFDHGWTVYNSEARGVLMVRLPGGGKAGSEYKYLTSSTDVLPTLTEYLGLPTPPGVDGEAIELLDTSLRQSGDPPRVCFSEGTKPWDEVETDPRWFGTRKARGVRRGPYKYIRTEYRGTEELYNLDADPLERNNLLSGGNVEMRALARELADILNTWTNAADPLPTRFEPSQREETIRRLRALGYLRDDGG